MDILHFVWSTLCSALSPDRPEWMIPLLGWNVGKAFSSAVKSVGNAFSSAGRGITRALTPPGSSAARDAMNAAARQQAAQDSAMATQIKQLQDQIAAANKAAADSEKARQAQEAEAKRQAMIREYDQSARTQQQQSFTAAKDRLSRMNQMRTEADTASAQGMQEAANSAGAKAMGIGGSTFDSLDFSKTGGFANSFDPELRKQSRAAAQLLKKEGNQVNKFGLPNIQNLTFGGA